MAKKAAEEYSKDIARIWQGAAKAAVPCFLPCKWKYISIKRLNISFCDDMINM
ncbi:MAG: hypothetical protein IJH93_01050 [Lachnospiraceae bacterium]|nr:hypothetical protein [Lachnospiraceae bacterium]